MIAKSPLGGREAGPRAWVRDAKRTPDRAMHSRKVAVEVAIQPFPSVTKSEKHFGNLAELG